MPSSVVLRLFYDPERRELFVHFVSGRAYVYEGVPAEVHAAFAGAPSKGTFFNRFIRDRYRFREVARKRA